MRFFISCLFIFSVLVPWLGSAHRDAGGAAQSAGTIFKTQGQAVQCRVKGDGSRGGNEHCIKYGFIMCHVGSDTARRCGQTCTLGIGLAQGDGEGQACPIIINTGGDGAALVDINGRGGKEMLSRRRG